VEEQYPKPQTHKWGLQKKTMFGPIKGGEKNKLFPKPFICCMKQTRQGYGWET